MFTAKSCCTTTNAYATCPCMPHVAAGTQWHPEKPTSEFGMVEVPHTLDAIRVSQHLANYFIDTGGVGMGGRGAGGLHWHSDTGRAQAAAVAAAGAEPLAYEQKLLLRQQCQQQQQCQQ
jgi:hypothetical protein